MSELKTLETLEKKYQSLSGLKAVVRLDWNVPIVNGKVVDSYRIDASLPTINWLRERGVLVRIVSHIKNVEGNSLSPVIDVLREKGISAKLINSIDDINAVSEADSSGDLVVFENIRNEEGEEKDDLELAKRIAVYGDFYVNDAFSASHRNHASIVSVPKIIPGFLGLQMQAEIEGLSKVFNPKTPLVAIIGGSKFDTKLPLIERLRKQAQVIYVVGALAHDVYLARGYPIGLSPFSGQIDMKDVADDSKIVVPADVIVTNDDFSAKGIVKKIEEVSAGDRIVDAGPEFLKEVKKMVETAGTVVWNGPLGFYEKGYSAGTDDVACYLKDVSADTILGGGDTLTAIARCGSAKDYTFVSTAGGAMLDFLADGTLPGIEAIR